MHFIHDVITRGDVLVEMIATSDNSAANVMTKALPSVKFKYCLGLVGIGSVSWHSKLIEHPLLKDENKMAQGIQVKVERV